MNQKIVLFGAWVVAGMNSVNLLALALKFSPALNFGFIVTLGGFSIIALIIAWFSPSTRPWLALISVILLMGGAVWLL